MGVKGHGFEIRGSLPLALGVLLLSLALDACASGGGRDVAPPIPPYLQAWLLSPVEGYGAVPLAQRVEIEDGYRALVERGETAAAMAAAAGVLARDPTSWPARVLAAQAEVVLERFSAAVQRLEGLPDREPDYLAGILVYGQAADLAGNALEALRAYRMVTADSDVAARRAKELEPIALDAALVRFDELVERSRFDEARQQLAFLIELAPNDLSTLERRRRLAEIDGLPEEELSILRQMVDNGERRVELLTRQAQLEISWGEARVGLETLQDLVARYPERAELRTALAEAQFEWRVQLFPEHVRRLVDSPQLSRAELAELLFWAVPHLRSASTRSATIATDILDHPYREAIARLINLRVIPMDNPSVHEFAPDKPATRLVALQGLLVMARDFANAGCASELPSVDRPGATAVCQLAVRCDLIETTSCLPEATVPGVEALELIRLALPLLGPR